MSCKNGDKNCSVSFDGYILLCSKCQREIKCPFCKEEDFDLIGLKKHLLADCCKFAEQPNIYNNAQAAIKQAEGE